ncbi:MAG TPA: ATP phosphoribosyltransferase regulatory subunit [Thermoanaerobaculia bacterium]|nr:ATP phosphoribosyltransferase regulatory subunit [Thermoanaerobaculia bacterium]
MRISTGLPIGVTALLFDAAGRRKSLEDALVGRLVGNDYSEVVLPILDYAEPYEALLSPASRGEFYRFVDRDGEVLALRSDFTPLLARLIAPRLAGLSLPLRLFYRGDVVRWAEERAGRLRESYQVGAELLGLDGEAAEAEVLRLFLDLLAASGAPRPAVIVGFAGALDELLLAAVGESGADPSELAAAVARRERSAVRRLGGSVALLEVVDAGVPADPAALGVAGERLIRCREVVAALAGAHPEIAITIDLAEFAQLSVDSRLRMSELHQRSYYDGLVFRGYAGAGGNEIGGGGRYNRLFDQLGVDLPAVGFTLGLDGLTSVSVRESASGAEVRS